MTVSNARQASEEPSDVVAAAERFIEAVKRAEVDPTAKNTDARVRAFVELQRAQAVASSGAADDTNDARPAALVAHELTMEDARNPPVEHFVVGALFPFGKASVVYGPSGAGKSTFLSQLTFKVASGGGGTFLGMHMHDQAGAPVLIYTLEDTLDDWRRKAATILCGCSDDIDVERALTRIRIIENEAGIARLTELVQVREEMGLESFTRSRLRPTPERLGIIEQALKLGARFIVIETASRLVEKEDNENMAALISAAGNIASATGAAVIISHHPTKAAAKDGDSSPENARGGYAFIANARNAVSIFPADEAAAAKLQARGMHVATRDLLTLGHEKGTSSVPTQDPILLVRCHTDFGGVLRLPEQAAHDPQERATHAARADKERRSEDALFAMLYDLVAELLAAGPVSPSKLRENHRARLGNIPKNGPKGVEALVGRAIHAEVLTALRRDKMNRILALGLGSRPGDPRATSTPDPRFPDDQD